MPPTADPPPALMNLLAVYLAAAPGLRCPGCDGMLAADVIPGYPAAATAGTVPGEVELLTRHPELAAHVVAFFFLLAVAPPARSNPAAVNGGAADDPSGWHAAGGID